MIESALYQDSDRYQNNTSPEPSANIALNQCFKTPIYQNVNTMIHNGQLPLHNLYPTPPSDNEDSNHLNTRLDLDNTPKLNDNFYYSNISNKNINSYKATVEQPQSLNMQNEMANKSEDLSNESTNTSPPSNQNTNSNRYKRRSRTTYSKHQLDTLETTFQKTHYPEIRIVDELSSMLNLSTERISIWFQNRRARFKKARKLENQQEISNPAPFKPIDVSYSSACPNVNQGSYPYPSSAPSNLDPGYLLNTIDKNPLKLSNHQSIADKMSINKFGLPSIQETPSYSNNLTTQTTNSFYFNQYPNILSNEQNFYNHNYHHLIRNETHPSYQIPIPDASAYSTV